MDLFDLMAQKQLKSHAPLAERMKPEKLEDFIGQESIMGEGKLLPKLIKSDRLSSIILYGPPGSGKTSLAKVIAKHTQAEFMSMNAVTSGVKDIREAVDKAKDQLAMYQKRTVLFIDEIHRFNKSQQDALLPFVEDGTFILIGATTENPYFEVNGALISRSSVFRLNKLSTQDIIEILKRALSDKERGLGIHPIVISDDLLYVIADLSTGDARRALNILEMVTVTKLDLSDRIEITLSDIEDSLQVKSLDYDKNGDNHYDITSAFIKSMRGSDPDAALYYLGKMIVGGEDPRFIARRIVICAAEDVGNADPMALVVSNSAAQAVDFIGMPEGRILLAQAVTYVATAPKSNAAYLGIDEVLSDLNNIATGSIPYYLKDGTSLSLERKYLKQGSGQKYLYPHDFDDHYVKQQYLPDEIAHKRYYKPSKQGHEVQINQYLNRTKYSPE